MRSYPPHGIREHTEDGARKYPDAPVAMLLDFKMSVGLSVLLRTILHVRCAVRHGRWLELASQNPEDIAHAWTPREGMPIIQTEVQMLSARKCIGQRRWSRMDVEETRRTAGPR